MTAIVDVMPDAPAPEAIRRAVERLRAGEPVVIPTETVYGVACDPRVPGAEDRLFAVKQRPREKRLPWLIPDLKAAERAGARWTPAARALAERCWPGPLTLVLEMADGRAIGFRVPAHPTALALLRAYGAPLATTSANRSGEPPARDAQAAAQALGNAVALILDAGPAPGGVPSTVVRMRDDRVEILREGALSREELEG